MLTMDFLWGSVQFKMSAAADWGLTHEVAHCDIFRVWQKQCTPVVFVQWFKVLNAGIILFLVQQFWQTIRERTRWEWLRSCLCSRPFWTLFPAVPFLNHHLLRATNNPYLPYLPLCLRASSPPPPLCLFSFFSTVAESISREDEVIVFLDPLKLKMHKREEAISLKKVIGASVSMRGGGWL